MFYKNAYQINPGLQIFRKKLKHFFSVVIVVIIIEICKNLVQNFGLLMYIWQIHKASGSICSDLAFPACELAKDLVLTSLF